MAGIKMAGGVASVVFDKDTGEEFMGIFLPGTRFPVRQVRTQIHGTMLGMLTITAVGGVEYVSTIL